VRYEVEEQRRNPKQNNSDQTDDQCRSEFRCAQRSLEGTRGIDKKKKKKEKKKKKGKKIRG